MINQYMMKFNAQLSVDDDEFGDEAERACRVCTHGDCGNCEYG